MGERSVLGALTPTSRRVLLGNGICALGSGLTFSFLVIYLGQVRGLGTTAAGLIIAYIAILGLGCTLLSGTLVDRFGPRPVLIAGLAVEAVGIAGLTLVDSVPSAIAVATVLSLGNAGFWAPQSALYARVTPVHRRQDVFGLQFMVLNLGLGIGGLLAALIIDTSRPDSFVLLYLIDACTYLAYIAILVPMRGVGVGPSGSSLTMVEPAPDEPDGYRIVLRDRAMMWLAAAALVMLTFGYGSLEVGLPTYATIEVGLPASSVAFAYAVNTAVIVIVQIGMLKLMRGRSRTRLGVIAAVLWSLSWLLVGSSIGFSPLWATIVICAGIGLFGLGESIWAPIAPAIVNDLAPERVRGRYNAVIGWTWSVSGALGPAFAALMLGAGLPVVWVATVVGGCLVGAVLLLRVHRLITPAQDGRSHSVT
jgi:MFS family permease